MSWKISTDALFAAFDVLDLVPTRPGIPASEYIKAVRKKNSLVEFHIASEISGFVVLKGEGDWPTSKVWYIDRRLLAPFVIAAKAVGSKVDFEFSLKEGQMVVRHGRRRATFTESPAVPGYGDVPSNGGSSISLAPEALSLIVCAREFASGDPSTPELNCVFIRPSNSKGDLRIYAATKKVIYYARSGEHVKMAHSLPMPPYIVSLLSNDKLRKIYWTKREVVLEFRNGKVWQSTSVKAAKFPVKSVHKYFEDSEAFREAFRVDSRALALGICRLGAYLTAVRREDWTLAIRGSKGADKLSLRSAVPQVAFGELVRDAKIKVDIDLVWPLGIVLPLFMFLSTKRKEGDLIVRLDKDDRPFVKTKHIQVVLPKQAEKGKKKK